MNLQKQWSPIFFFFLLIGFLYLIPQGAFPQHATTTSTAHSTHEICKHYHSLTSTDRQNISNARHALEIIKQNQSDEQFHEQLKITLNHYAVLFSTEPMINHLQGLVAEAFLRRLIFKSLGLSNASYKTFTIFIDLITYHRAMDHKGFVDLIEFAKARLELEKAIKYFYDEKQKPFLQMIQNRTSELTLAVLNETPIQGILKENAKFYIELENQKSQMLGSIDIIWNQVRQRNQQNQEEVNATNAAIDLSVNAALSVIGFGAIIKATIATATGTATSVAARSSSLGALAMNSTLGCGLAISGRYVFNKMNLTFLDMSKALYHSLQNNTSFACELGQLATSISSDKDSSDTSLKEPLILPKEIDKITTSSERSSIHIPDSSGPTSTSEYLVTCAFGGVARVYPHSLGVGIDGLLTGLFAFSTYNLVHEFFVVLTELPRLEDLKSQAGSLKDSSGTIDLIHKEIDQKEILEKKIKESEAKITLHLLAMGNTSLNILRFGAFLYIDRAIITKTLSNFNAFLSRRYGYATPPADIQNLRLMADKLQ